MTDFFKKNLKNPILAHFSPIFSMFWSKRVFQKNQALSGSVLRLLKLLIQFRSNAILTVQSILKPLDTVGELLVE